MRVYTIVEKRFRRYQDMTPGEKAEAVSAAQTGQEWFRDIVEAMEDKALWVLLIVGYHKKIRMPVSKAAQAVCEYYYSKWLQGERSVQSAIGLIWENTVKRPSQRAFMEEALGQVSERYPVFYKLFGETYGFQFKHSREQDSALIPMECVQECSICYIDKHALKFRDCGHSACGDCTLQLLKTSGKCHMCRAPISKRPRAVPLAAV